MKNPKMSAFEKRNGSWLFAGIGCIVLWILMGLFGSGISLRSLIDNAYTASFLAIAGLAQMLVVTTGRGAIDLSIPGMITLGAYTCMGLCNGQNSMIIPALLVVILEGALVGVLNSAMVIWLKIPAIIATMAMNYMIVTVTMLINNQFNVFYNSFYLEEYSYVQDRHGSGYCDPGYPSGRADSFHADKHYIWEKPFVHGAESGSGAFGRRTDCKNRNGYLYDSGNPGWNCGRIDLRACDGGISGHGR